MKLVQGRLSARKSRESRFHHCGGLVSPVQDCLTGWNDRESRFHHLGDLVKLV